MNPDLPLDGAVPAGEALLSGRPPYRPPVGLPDRERRSWRGTAFSFALHALVILLLIVPFFPDDATLEHPLGAGGAGPTGGGGGGRGGTGGEMIKERLQYLQVAPAPKPAQTPAPKPAQTPAVVPPVVPPVVKPPVVPPPVTPPPKPAAAVTPPAVTPPAPAASVAPGAGGGSGTDGSAGNGPGTGGGVGTGEGTGRGADRGPGTGGGTGTVYQPVPSVLLLLPQAPSKLRGTTIVARFDVDEKGRVLKIEFTETRDGGYNRKVRETLSEMRFRPGTTPDGTPVRAVAEVTFTI